MVDERVICCCGASTWTKVIAWYQIVMNVILLIVCIIGLIGIAAIEVDEKDETANNQKLIATAALGMGLVLSIIGLIMGIVLLKGTNERHVGYIRAWIIYGVVAVIISIINIILNTRGENSGAAVLSGIVGIGINHFCIVIVSIHMKEIQAGVFM